MLKDISNKKAALELSIGTIVIIVLAMTMLILGLVLVRGIFRGATESVDELNSKTQKEIRSLFSDEGTDIVVKLGSDKTANIKQGTENFAIGLGARTPDGSKIDSRDRLQYKLELDDRGENNCLEKLGRRATEALFKTTLDSFIPFDEFDGSNAYALIELTVPKGTASCSQKVFIDVKDSEDNNQFGGSFFKINIIKRGFF
jgi:hypothetical protein